MNKIMFNDKFGLTQAVLSGRKTQTRRLCTLTLHKKEETSKKLIEVYPSKIYIENDKWKFVYDNFVFPLPKDSYPKYKVGEIVAVAQSYKCLFDEDCERAKRGEHMRNVTVRNVSDCAGWNNKMFVAATEMPHQIRITDVRIERLQDISDTDCLAEGISKIKETKVSVAFGMNDKYEIPGKFPIFNTAREAYSELIDNISGRGTWDSNPYVFVYEFELIK